MAVTEVVRLVLAVQREEEVLVVAAEPADAEQLAADGDLAGQQPDLLALAGRPSAPTSPARASSTSAAASGLLRRARRPRPA